MSITDELRKWAEDGTLQDRVLTTCPPQHAVHGVLETLLRIADRIDERWEREEADFDLMSDKIEAQADCLIEVGEALGVSADQPDSEFFWELAEAARGCIPLPKDADGVPFHIGELVDEMLPFGGYAAPAPIDTMELSRGASGYGWMVKLDAENRASISPSLLRHHHAPTVEDVLRAFWSDVDLERADGCGDFSPIIAEYAAKLRLAGDAE